MANLTTALEERLLHDILVGDRYPVGTGIKAGSFSRKRAHVFRACRDLAMVDHRPVDLLTVAQKLESNGRLREVGYEYLAHLVAGDFG